MGEKPPYVRTDALSLEGLAQIDTTIFEHACRVALKQGHADVISGEQIVNDLREQEISEAQIMETQQVLESRHYIEIHRVMGPPHVYAFSITTYGFDQFAHAGIPEYRRICGNVGRCLVNGQASKHSIADELNEPPFIVEHIFEALAANNLIKYATSIGGDRFMDVYWISPELRRTLEGNN